MLKRALSLLETVFKPNVLEEGRRCYQQGHVLMTKMSDGLLRARVKGYANHIYNVFLDLKIWPDQAGHCNCVKKYNCEHVLAALLAMQPDGVSKKNLAPVETPSYLSNQPLVTSHLVDLSSLTWYSHSEPMHAEGGYFSYELGVVIDGQTLNLVPWIVALIDRYGVAALARWPDDTMVQWALNDRQTLALPIQKLRPFLHFLTQEDLKIQDRTAYLQLTRYQLLWMREAEAAMEASLARWHGTTLIQDILTRLGSPHPQITPPQGLQTTLRDYQLAGLDWLNQLRIAGLGGVLADDMGLGKTVQTLAILQAEKEAGRLKKACLIVAPASVIGNWKQEASRLTPGLRTLLYHGTDRRHLHFDDYDIVITTYGLMQRDKRLFLAYSFYYLILDEAQFIKNTQTKTRQIIQQFHAEHRLCLTGTPLENHLGELWSLFHFLMPGLLGHWRQFKSFFKDPIEKHKDASRHAWLVKRIQPFLLRRTKNQVLTELPPKTDITLTVELKGQQRELYEMIRMKTEQTVRDAIARQGLLKSQWVVLDALLKLRQVCCDPMLLKMPEGEKASCESIKLETCLELLENLMEEKRTVLVFSQFTEMLALIEKALIKRGYAYLKLTGSTRNRQTIVERFQSGEAPIFLISLRAGGTGLNLTQADTVIHYDPWWNPAVEDQATDRSYRMGQQKPVFVYRLLTKGTVEEAMSTMQLRKRDLFLQMFSGSSDVLSSGFTEADLHQFFGPIG